MTGGKTVAGSHWLIKPDGTPLRANASVTFHPARLAGQPVRPAGAAQRMAINVGDTLPLLARQIYGNPYLKTAQFEGVLNFRTLAPIPQLVFPALSGSAV
ncbi:MAG: hypothetical protein V4564_17285 [Pseudomonadota bacterium]|uniref:hypothetical protein n=1 Tax=Sphingomonas sp. ERG5 TaxID=1381597 RepID=UPI0006917C71|nr:hypothetical protein [Sphingomonas sp. ERG5]